MFPIPWFLIIVQCFEFQAENVFSQGYIRGNGVEFIEVDVNDPCKPPKGYSPNDGEHTADFIAVLIPYGSGDRLPPVSF